MRTGARQGRYADRDNDLYETPACATHALLKTGELDNAKTIWEPCAGRGAIARILIAAGHDVIASDLIDYDGSDKYITSGIDFFVPLTPAYAATPSICSAIVTNPPFMYADKFVRHAMNLGLKTVVLLRLMALEGSGRSDLIDNHLRRVWLGRERLPWMHRDGWTGARQTNSGAPFAWFVFEPEPSQEPIQLRRISWKPEPSHSKNPSLDSLL